MRTEDVLFPDEGFPLCVACQRLRRPVRGGWACAAFPGRIPGPLLDGSADHRAPIPGDQGIRFEPDWQAPDAVLSGLGFGLGRGATTTARPSLAGHGQCPATHRQQQPGTSFMRIASMLSMMAFSLAACAGMARAGDGDGAGGSVAAPSPSPARGARPAEVRTTNRLVLIGGHEDKAGAEVILREFVELAGGDRARILVLTYPSKHEDEFLSDYRRAFGRLGVRETRFARIAGREDADSEETCAAAERATGVFFVGGSQSDVAGSVRQSRLWQIVTRRGDAVVVGGTSAGAAVMAETMLSTGSSYQGPLAGDIELEPGLGLIRGVIIDTHFSQRGRLGRMAAALAERPDQLGVGLGEDTAMVVEGTRIRVLGRGVVTILDAGHLRHNNRAGLKDGVAIALVGLEVDTLPSGYRYDLKARALLEPDPGRAEARR